MADSVALEEKVRTVIEVSGYQAYRSDPLLMTELDSYFDGYPTADIERFKEWIKNEDIRVVQGWPHPTQARFPCHSVIPDEGKHMEERMAMADILDESFRVTETDVNGNPFKMVKARTIGEDWESTLAIGSWAVEAELTPLLHSFVCKVLFENKWNFLGGYTQHLIFAEDSFVPDEHYRPQISYVRILKVVANQEISWKRKEQFAGLLNRTTLLPGTFSVGS